MKLFQVDTTTYYRKRIQDPYIYAYRFQVLTGLRPGELMGLRWADVHGNTLQISRSINIEGTQTRGKNDNSVRAFVMSELARAVLEQQRQQGEQSALRAVAQCAGDPHALQAMLAGFFAGGGVSNRAAALVNIHPYQKSTSFLGIKVNGIGLSFVVE